MTNLDYCKWIGLPHAIGADPDDGKFADCLIVASKVLRAQGLYCPPLNSQWFDWAKEGQWKRLLGEWKQHMERTDKAEEGCVCLHGDDEQLFGMGVFIDAGFLLVSHRKGVVWIPLALMPTRQLWRVKHAAV